jgi:hypothetical protein
MAKKDIAGAKLAWGRQLSLALDNLWEPYHIASKQFTYGGLAAVPEKEFVDESDKENWMKDAAPRIELVALARKMIAAYDRLIFGDFVPKDVAKRLGPRRNLLNQFVVKYFDDRERIEPGWNRKARAMESQEDEEEAFLDQKAEISDKW